MTNHIRVERVLLLALALGVLVLAFYKLGHYPIIISLDEGYRLQLPKNLALHGRWAALLNGQFVPYWADSTGPAVLLPIALAFKAWGVSLINARVVMSVYVVFTAFSVYALTRFLYGRWAALLSVPLLLFAGPRGYSALARGREVFGEMPALGFFFLGVLCWCKFVSGPQQRQPKFLVMACACFVAMTLCKDLFAVFTCATLVAIGLGMWRSTPTGQPRLYMQAAVLPAVVMVFTFGAWRMAQGLLTQGQGFDATAQQMADLTPGSYVLVLFNFRLWGEALRYLYESEFVLLGIPALLFAFATALRQRSPQRWPYVFVPIFVSFWSVWFVFFSITWPRYFMPAWCAGAILISHFLVQGLWQKLTHRADEPSPVVGAGNRLLVNLPHALTQLAVLALIFVITAWPAQNEFRRIRTSNNTDAVAMAQFVQTNMPPPARVLSTEWEVSLFTERPMQYPSFGAIDRLIRAEKLAGAPPNDSGQGVLDVTALRPEYIVVGDYNRTTRIVPPVYLQTHCQIMVALEDYQAYQCLR